MSNEYSKIESIKKLKEAGWELVVDLAQIVGFILAIGAIIIGFKIVIWLIHV